jgi:hypothetical protein
MGMWSIDVQRQGVEERTPKGARIMVSQLVPVLSAGSGNSAGVPAKPTKSFRETLNEAVVIVFFSLGPALGAAIFLMWFGGLVWGLLSSFLR